jgi:hypothetical protein
VYRSIFGAGLHAAGHAHVESGDTEIQAIRAAMSTDDSEKFHSLANVIRANRGDAQTVAEAAAKANVQAARVIHSVLTTHSAVA